MSVINLFYRSYPLLLYDCVLVAIADRSREWQPNSRRPPRGKCFSGNGGCVWGGYTRSEHWLAGSRLPLYELCSLCQWLLLECNSFVSKGWRAGQKFASSLGMWRRASTFGWMCEWKSNILFAYTWNSSSPSASWPPPPSTAVLYSDSRRSKSGRSKKTTHAGHIVCFLTNSEGTRDKPVSEQFVSPDICCGIWEAGDVRRSPGNSYIDNGWHRWD